MTAPMRIRTMSVVVGLLMVVAACAKKAPVPPPAPTATATPPAAAAPAIQRAGLPTTLVVGTSGGSPPYTTRRASTITGLEVDLATEVGKVLGIPVRIVDVPWPKLFEALASRRVEVVMAGVTMTPEREKRFAFVDPYLRTGLVTLVRSDGSTRIAAGDDLCKAKKIAVVGKTTGERYVRETCRKVKPRVYKTADDAVNDVAAKKIDAVVDDGPVLAYLAGQQTVALDLVPTGKGEEDLAWMVRQNDTALRQALNEALETMSKNGTLERVLKQWIPHVEQVRAR